jgi:protein-tyrosine-phosphatase
MNSVLFVCSANMCRSPMAEVLFKNLLYQHGAASKWFIYSAGVWAWDGNRASQGAVKAMQRKGIDLSTHRSRLVSQEMIIENDLVLVMEQNHKEALQASFPKFARKIYLLSEMVGMKHDILDPIGGTAADYEDTADELEKLLDDAFARIHTLVNEREDQPNQ